MLRIGDQMYVYVVYSVTTRVEIRERTKISPGDVLEIRDVEGIQTISVRGQKKEPVVKFFG